LDAEPGGIDAAAFHPGKVKDAVKFLADFRERLALEFDSEAVPDNVADSFANIDDGEMLDAANVNTDVEIVGAAFEIAERLEAMRAFAFRKQIIFEEDGLVVTGDAAVFLKPLFIVDAFAFALFEKFLAGHFGFHLLIDLLDQPGANGVKNINAMMGPALGVAAIFDLGKDLIEDGVSAAMGGNDRERAAPRSGGLGIAIEQALIFVESEFIKLDVAGPGSDGVNVGREGIDAFAGGEAKDACLEVLFGIDDAFSQVLGGDMEDGSPLLADLEIEFGGIFILGRDPYVQRDARRDFADRVIGVGEGNSDLA